MVPLLGAVCALPNKKWKSKQAGNKNDFINNDLGRKSIPILPYFKPVFCFTKLYRQKPQKHMERVIIVLEIIWFSGIKRKIQDNFNS